MAIYMAIYGQFFIFVWPYFGRLFSNFFIGVSEARDGGRAGRQGASLTPMKKLEAMTGNCMAKNGHILAEISQKCTYFPKTAPRGSKISVDVFNSKVSDWTIVSAIRKSLTS